ncbi:MAG TPA: carbohydrate-binding protein [Gaiellaceae bacterium]|nr:carbohydrate-binding protein [Gaiellaceae bacterium]
MSDKRIESPTGLPGAGLAPPKPQLSLVRILLLLIVITGFGLGGWHFATRGTPAADARSNAVPVYAPYVDVTQTPTYSFQLPSANPVSSVYLGFVVSDPGASCRPSWGGYYTLSQAEQALDLDSRTAQLRNEGGSVMISFGGRDNSELAVGCTDTDRLVDAYLAPIERYHATGVDLDLEGNALNDPIANERRAKAMASIQRRFADRHKSLRIWLTLPVARSGLTAAGIAAVRAMLAAHVQVAGVNAMAMNFGSRTTSRGAMTALAEQSLNATHVQVQSLWRSAGLPSSASSGWGHVGVTVMIGVNDTANERFTTTDAAALTSFVSRHGIQRVSIWSLNRDRPCGGVFPRVGVVSNTCSGVLQAPLEFTRILGRLRGTTVASSAATVVAPMPAAARPVDDPATSPYPIWRAAAAYDTGYKVVWQRVIYQAAWWSQGTPPDAAGAASATGPWQPIGPVPPGSHAAKVVRLVHGALRRWSPDGVYRQGDRVTFNGLPYEARWYTLGDQPVDDLPADPGAPWRPLFKFPNEPAAAGTGVETK